MKFVTIDGFLICESGGNSVQELAYILACGAEYIMRLSENGLKPESVVRQLRVHTSVASESFREISKIRALRLTWNRMLEAFSEKLATIPLAVDASTALRNKSYYDPWVNMLRVTNEAFAAICAGCDSLNVKPFDAAIGLSDDFALRIARNTQIILKEESNLDKVIDPAAGSAYIEELSMELTEKAWELFLNIEKDGGIIESIKNNRWQKRIRENSNSQILAYQHRKKKAVGSNIYPNIEEKTPSRNFEHIPIKELNIDQKIAQLKTERALIKFEEFRLNVEGQRKQPLVYVAQYGNKAKLKARADFVRGFFEVASFKVRNEEVYNDMDQLLNAALFSKADVVVLCALDEDYHDLVAKTAKKIRNRLGSPLFLAGRPGENEQLWRQQGVDEFVHSGSNVYQILYNILKG